MHVYTASITTTTILTPAVQNLNVKNVVDGQSLFLYNKDKYQLYQKASYILRITYPIIVEKR